MAMELTARFTANAAFNEEDAVCVVAIGSSVFVRIYQSGTPIPGNYTLVAKVDKAAMTEDDRYRSTTLYASFGRTMATDGTYLYVGTYGGGANPSTILKIDPSDMSVVGQHTSADLSDQVGCVVINGGYLYFGTSGNSPPIVVKVDLSDMSEADRYTGNVADEEVYSLGTDGTYIYVGLTKEPATILQLDPSDMSEVARFESGAGFGGISAVACDGTYVYGIYDFMDPDEYFYVVQVDPSDMSEVDHFGDVSLAKGFSLLYDGTYLMGGTQDVPGVMLQINVPGLTENDRFTADVGQGGAVLDIAYDGSAYYAAHSNDPAIVSKVGGASLARAHVIITSS